MTLDAFIMLVGALVALLPYLGFPNSWDRVILLVLGICIVIVGVVVRRRGTKKNVVLEAPRTFEEHVQPELSQHDTAQ